MAFLTEKAGGKAITGADGRILSIIPKGIHERCGIIVGSPDDVEEVEDLYKKHKKNWNIFIISVVILETHNRSHWKRIFNN